MKHSAILLLGPTGSGKSPLGQLIEARGLWGARAVHFDFGANLRQIIQKDQPGELVSREDIEFIQRVLRSGALLENEHFPIAERVLRSFLAEHVADNRTLVILNGLPRHVGQAKAIDGLLQVHAVVHLECSPETVLARIRSNVGGDRGGRSDDDMLAVQEKLAIFSARTAPLLDYYQSCGARILAVAVTDATTPDETWRKIDDCRIKA